MDPTNNVTLMDPTNKVNIYKFHLIFEEILYN